MNQTSSNARPGAGDGDSERNALFTALAERLAHGEASEDEPRRAHLIRLLTGLMPQVSRSARRAAAEAVSQMPDPPMDLAMMLARDEAEAAGPLLRDAPFTQSELIELVMRTGPEHHIEIARRADLTLDVWLALARAATQRAHATPQADADAVSRGEAARSLDALEAAAERAQPRSEPPPRPQPAPPRETAPPAAPPAPRLKARTRPQQSESQAAASAEEAPGPLADTSEDSWQFETGRDGRLARLSANARAAFGDAALSLRGEPFANVLQIYSAAPAPDAVGEAMSRRAPVRDMVVETLPPGGEPKRWRLRAQPRFSFPEGRFQGYAGMARDLDSPGARPPRPRTPDELLERLARAAERLAAAATTPELEDYARTVRDCAESLKGTPGASPPAAKERSGGA